MLLEMETFGHFNWPTGPNDSTYTNELGLYRALIRQGGCTCTSQQSERKEKSRSTKESFWSRRSKQRRR
ncbi:hypothetical protein COMA2_20435 [Candidatus Nitrospira nitrificans]|uniref:Uncharacterized protein n=1 Tax=Candidatus Nitrospira nitrificans TaxID=1742973 RepID=A0A0S4LIK8_9BACT|nr:hypothetical protein COMA2_20435 [Candidatus Nitrospira nitrificans]